MSGRVGPAGDVPRYPAPAPGFTYQPWMFQTGRDNAPAEPGGGVRCSVRDLVSRRPLTPRLGVNTPLTFRN